jgi:hypothetical protein
MKYGTESRNCKSKDDYEDYEIKREELEIILKKF